MAPDWRQLLVTEVARAAREGLDSWSRAVRLCLLVIAIAMGIALVLWANHH
jgi:hypothetical protein